MKQKGMTVADTAARIAEVCGRKFTERTITNWLNSGKLKGAKIGGVWFVSASALRVFLSKF